MTAAERRPGLILGSGSRTRRQILAGTGLPFTVIPSKVDESAIKARGMARNLAHDDIVYALAEAKGLDVSQSHPQDMVIAADQILSLDDRILDKPVGPDGVRDHLRLLGGRSHFLRNAIVLVQGGRVVWSYRDCLTMTMRPLSDRAIAAYVSAAPADVVSSVGGYQIEGIGIHLFSAMDPDWNAIRGLPLVPLLAGLRAQGMDGLPVV